MNSRKERLSNIKKKSEELNKLADAATAEIAEVEKQLIEAGAGVEVWDGVIRSVSTVRNDGGYDSPNVGVDHEFRLGFAKIDGKWGIAINEYVQISEDCPRQGDLIDDEKYFLRNAPRDIRIDAIPYIDELLEEIEKAIEEKAKSLSK